MKLSDAILLGSTLSPQAFAVFEDQDGRRCALGAALAAVGRKIAFASEATTDLWEFWPHLLYPCYGSHWGNLYVCPEDCGGSTTDLFGMITHLNDDHSWPRERIAGYTARFDPPEAVEVEVPCSCDAHADGGPGPGIATLKAPAP